MSYSRNTATAPWPRGGRSCMDGRHHRMVETAACSRSYADVRDFALRATVSPGDAQ